MHDRGYYRALSAGKLLQLAREEGISPEMAIAITEQLAEKHGLSYQRGHYAFNFNHRSEK